MQILTQQRGESAKARLDRQSKYEIFHKKCHLYLVGDEICDYFKRFIVFVAQTLMPPSYITGT